ncbi:MAG: ATP-binding protein [Candidatus Limnocylindrales bacterium]
MDGKPPSLARRFLLASLAVLVVGGVVIGWWVGGQLERGIIDRTASITGLYIDSFVEPHLESLSAGQWLSPTDVADLDALVTNNSFGQRVVALKVWRPDGVIVYSPDRSLIGQSFAVADGLAEALDGTVVAAMSNLEANENVGEQARGFSRLLEMYVPVRERGGDRIIAVAEFYQLPTDIEQQVWNAQVQSWLVVAGAVALAFLLLFGIVRGGSNTIASQQVALERQVAELSALLDQNELLRKRVRIAAERTTTLSERNLRRISSDLHDGPGQMLALALLRLDQLRGESAAPVRDATVGELHATLDEALTDMRAIAAGLRLPELTNLSAADALRRAVDDHVRRTGIEVALTVETEGEGTSLPTKIALFRAVQELLSNATRHGQGRDVSVDLARETGQLRLTVSDGGPGLAQAPGTDTGHLGLEGVREQAELLGGSFELSDRSSGGTVATVRWPA